MAAEPTTGERKPNLARVMRGLKDFQRDTVDHVVGRMFDDASPAYRFLVADEVGLGKTWVARGVIAAAIDRLWNTVDRIDIVYICSNADIARQNLEHLRFAEAGSAQLASRITLLPATLKNLTGRKLNIVSFTPGTSFDLGTSMGLAEERVLLYFLLCDAGWFRAGEPARRMMQGNSGADAFRARIRGYDRRGIDEGLRHDFVEALNGAALRSSNSGVPGEPPTLKERFVQQYEQFVRSRRARADLPHELKAANSRIIAELRMLLAETCLTALQPDVIVLDEFQRFKHLLDEGDAPLSRLAHRMFNYQDASAKARVLLLSATPYKMYTVANDHEGDDHYGDFLRTVRFLFNDPEATARFETTLAAYRREVTGAAAGGIERLATLKDELQTMLRSIMVRTERLAASHDRNGMLRESGVMRAAITPEDVRSYAGLRRVARELGADDTIEFWKSAPYLLNFMEGYGLKNDFEALPPGSPERDRVAGHLAAAPGALLPWDAVQRYERVDPGNARLRSLVAATLDRGAWRLAWIPSSMPYYAPAGAFAEPGVEGLTKHLIFSSWRVVPKAIAALLSYEAERRMVAGWDASLQNTVEARKALRGPLRFRRDDLQNGMMTTALMYPAVVLARACDPLDVAREAGTEAVPRLSRDGMLLRIRSRVERLLATVRDSANGSVPAATDAEDDRRWYWAAPLLLDRHAHGEALAAWFGADSLATTWAGDALDADEEPEIRTDLVDGHEDGGDTIEDARPAERAQEGTAWRMHIAEARRLLAGEITLGKPPADLAEVIALLALAAPGIAALRSLARIAEPAVRRESARPEAMIDPEIRTAAARVGWAFRSLFNAPELVALLRGVDGDLPYWRRVLEYCADGNLQAMLDEYAHNLEGNLDRPANERATRVGAAMQSALALRTATIRADEIAVSAEGLQDSVHRRMRMHFALRFGDERGEREESGARKQSVQKAFNSPFWPFVLASTSVGQEGLDFHPYCHAVVHWNLPSNPVDLEQREGRVHRFKGHAVRRNVAAAYGPMMLAPGDHHQDPWNEMFARAAFDRDETHGDLVPYWVFPGPSAIERHVPAAPYSREVERLERLRRTLTLYRMVFGQPRQDDLLAYLVERVPEKDHAALFDALRIDISPRHTSHAWETRDDDRDDEGIVTADADTDASPALRTAPLRRDANAGVGSDGRDRDISEFSITDLVCEIRGVVAAAGRLTADDMSVAVARALGFRRTGQRIRDAVTSALNAAVRRGVVANVGGAYSLDCRTVTDYPDETLTRCLYAAIGRAWIDRDDAIRSAARYLGFRRTGATITSEFERLIRRVLQHGELRQDGTLIRRA